MLEVSGAQPIGDEGELVGLLRLADRVIFWGSSDPLVEPPPSTRLGPLAGQVNLRWQRQNQLSPSVLRAGFVEWVVDANIRPEHVVVAVQRQTSMSSRRFTVVPDC